MTNRNRKVDRSERVLPPPEAAQHRRVWPMQELLVMGPDLGGIDADEFESALQIVEAFAAFTRNLGFPTKTIDDRVFAGQHEPVMSERDAEVTAVWFEWSAHLPKGLPPRLVRWIEDDEPIGSVEVLRRACRLWDRVRSDREKLRMAALDRERHTMLTMPSSYQSNREIAARPANLPVQAICPSPATLPPPMSSTPMGARMRQPLPHHVSGADHAHLRSLRRR